MNSLDANTLQIISTIVIDVLMVLLVTIWFSNKTNKAHKWWGIFSIALAIDASLSTFPELRNLNPYVYLFNINGSLFYFAFLMGLLEFTRTNINKNMLYILMGSCVLINSIGAMLIFSDEIRRGIIVGYNSIFLIFSIYAVAKLDARDYILEKNVMIVLLAIHLGIHAYWVGLEFNISGANQTLFSESVTPIYIILILIMITLLLLTLGRIRSQLENENQKSVLMKNALSSALSETNVANKTKSIFLTNMSHELRTPLNIIIGYSEALKLETTGALNEKTERFCRKHNFCRK